MAGLRFRTFAIAAVLALGTAQWATASPIDLTVGDNDGFGFGAALVPDGSPLLDNILPDTPADAALSDRRSAAEKAATNGAQQTDIYTALLGYPLQPLPTAFDVIFPFVGELTSGAFSLDVGGFEANLYGQLSVYFNGIFQPGLFNFSDSELGTSVHSFVLGASALANATAAQQLVVSIVRDGTAAQAFGPNCDDPAVPAACDAVAFDYFRLAGNVETLTPQIPTPEPMTLVMLGTGLTALAMRRRRKA